MLFDKKEKYSIRTSNQGAFSAYIGSEALRKLAVVGTAVTMLGTTNGVLADENQEVVTTENPATNLVEAQPTYTDGALEGITNTGVQTGEIVTPIEESSFDQAVEAAVQAGIIVDEQPVVTHDSYTESLADLAAQEEFVESVTENLIDEQSKLETEVKEAEKAGVEIVGGGVKEFTGDNAQQINKDVDNFVKDQISKLDDYTELQGTISTKLPEAITGAENNGVAVNQTNPVTGLTYDQALKALNNAIAILNTAGQGQADLTNAYKQGQQATDDVNVTEKTVTTKLAYDQAEAARTIANLLKQVDGQVANIKELEKALSIASQDLKYARQAAEREGVRVEDNATAKDFTSAQELTNHVQAEVRKLEDAIKVMKDVLQTIEDAKNLAEAKGVEVKANETKVVTDKSEAERLAAQFKTAVDAEITRYEKALSDYEKEKAIYDAQVAQADKGQEDLNAFKAAVAEANRRIQAAANAKADELKGGSDKINTAATQKPEIKYINNLNYDELAALEKSLIEGLDISGGANSVKEIDPASKAARDQAVAAFEAKKANTSNAVDSGNGYTALGSTTNLPAISTNGIQAVGEGALTKANIASGEYKINVLLPEESDIDDSKIIKSIKWTNQDIVALDGGDVRMGQLVNKDALVNILGADPNQSYGGSSTYNQDKLNFFYNQNPDGGTTKYASVQSGKWYSIPGAVTTADGETHDLVFYVETVKPQNVSTNTGYVEMWNQGSVINAINGYYWGMNDYSRQWGIQSGQAVEITPTNDNGLTLNYRVDSKDNNDKYLWSNVITDIDREQFLTNDTSSVVTVGGGISVDGYKKGSTGTLDLDGIEDSPAGTITVVEYTNQYGYTLNNTTPLSDPKTASTVARGDFGNTAVLDIIPSLKYNSYSQGGFDVAYNLIDTSYTPPTVTTEDPTPPTKQTVTYTPVIYSVNVTPVTASAELTNNKLTVDQPSNYRTKLTVTNPNVKIAVHPVEVEQKPTNHKDVVNSDKSSIDGELVAKNSDVVWTLSNEALKAGRDYTVEYVVIDNLPQGYLVNLDETIAKAEGFKVDYNKDTHQLKFTATADTLFKLNADLTQAVNIPLIEVLGKVVNDGATYVNTFTTEITTAETVIRDKDGKIVETGPTSKYTVVSNNPKVYTPGDDYRTENGNVVVRYRRTSDNKPIMDPIVDVENGELGSDYDTTDNKPRTIVYDGKVYEITSKVEGQETGKVVPGTQFVTYYYDEVPMPKNEGLVVVNYKDEDGNTIQPQVIDTPVSPVGTDYDTTDNKPNTIVTPAGIEYELVPEKTEGDESGKVVEGVTEVTYVYKRITPLPPTPTPGDSKIKPEKDVVNKDGQSVNGKQLLPNTEIKYTLLWDLNQYKGMKASRADIAKGFAHIDDILDNTVTIPVDQIELALADGSAVKGVKIIGVNSIDELEDAHQALVLNSGVAPEGYFILMVAEDPEKFYEDYVVKGENIYITLPVQVGDYTGDFSNKNYQIDFGNGYEGDVVENNIPKLEAIKDILKSIGSGESIANGDIAIGTVFPYHLDGPAIRGNIVDGLQSYVFRDDFDENYDEYNGEYYVFLDKDMLLKDGTILKANSEITKYFTQVLEKDENGKVVAVVLEADENFLALLAEEGEFDPSAYIMVTRIAYGENIENKFTVTVNGFEVTSNTVVSHTRKPQPPTPETPVTPGITTPEVPVTPATPVTPVTPAEPVKEMPSTGAGSALGIMSALMGSTALLGATKRKRKQD